MSTYTFQCQCSEVLRVEAQDPQEAVEKLLPEGQQHLTNVHPDMRISDEDFRNMFRAGMQEEARSQQA